MESDGTNGEVDLLLREHPSLVTQMLRTMLTCYPESTLSLMGDRVLATRNEPNESSRNCHLFRVFSTFHKESSPDLAARSLALALSIAPNAADIEATRTMLLEICNAAPAATAEALSSLAKSDGSSPAVQCAKELVDRAASLRRSHSTPQNTHVDRIGGPRKSFPQTR